MSWTYENMHLIKSRNIALAGWEMGSHLGQNHPAGQQETMLHWQMRNVLRPQGLDRHKWPDSNTVTDLCSGEKRHQHSQPVNQWVGDMLSKKFELY